MEPIETINPARLEEIIAETNQIQFHLSQQKNLVNKTVQEVINHHKRLDELGREIPLLVKSISQSDDKDKLNETINSLDTSIRNKQEEKQMLLEAIKKLQAVEIPSQEERLNELKAQMELLQPKLSQKLHTIEKISQETAGETERINELTGKLQTLKKSIPEYETVYKEVIEEINSLDERSLSKTAEKQKILDAINNLQSNEIPKEEEKLLDLKARMESSQPKLRQRQEDLTKINAEIAVANKQLEETQMELQTLTNRYQEQIAIQDGLPKESVSLDTLLLSKQQEKQRILDKIKLMEAVAIPQENERIKEAREQIKQLQAEISQKQEPLNRLTSEMPLELQKLKELEKKEDYLKKEYQAAETNRRELAANLSQLEELIEKKKQERNKIDQWNSQVEAGTKQYTELIDKTKETTKILLDETHRRRELYGDVIPTVTPISHNQTAGLRPKARNDIKTKDSAKIFKIIFLVCMLVIMMMVMGIFIWKILSMVL
jgi:chromosome segregation ATPase